MGREEVRGEQPRCPDDAWAGSPVPSNSLLQTAAANPAPTAAIPAFFPALAAAAFVRPKATLPQQRRSHGTSARGRLNYKSRQAPREVRPLPPPPEKNPRTLREMPGPRNRTKPADGGGEGKGRGGHKGWKSLRRC